MKKKSESREALEGELLEKLAQGIFDGNVGGVYAFPGKEMWSRFVIWNGIPMQIGFKAHTEPSRESAAVERQYGTPEEKLWFLRNHGWKMKQAEAIRYSRTYREPMSGDASEDQKGRD